MKTIGRMIVAGAAFAASAQAQAADWWCVLGAPDAPVTQFVDADTAVRSGNRVSIHVLRFDRADQTQQGIEQVQCDARTTSAEHKALRDFACGTLDYRMNSAVMLGAMTPSQAAHVIFASRPATLVAAKSAPRPPSPGEAQ
jgi:hypothetical protein